MSEAFGKAKSHPSSPWLLWFSLREMEIDMAIILLGFQLWIRTILPSLAASLAAVFLFGILLAFLEIEVREFWEGISKYETKVTGSWAAKFGYIAGWVGLCCWGGFLVIIIMKRLG